MRRMMTSATTAALALALTACGSGDGGPGPTAGDGYDNTSTPAAPSTSDSDTSTSSSTSSPTSSPSETSSAEPTATSSSSSASSSSSTSTNTGKPFDPQEFTGNLEAAIEKNPTVAVDIQVTSDGQQTVQASGSQDLSDESLEMKLDLAGQEVTYRQVDGQYYLHQPPQWVAVTEDSSNPLMQQATDQITLLSMRTHFDAFVAGVEKAGTKGTEEIDGTETTHYTATVNTRRALAELEQPSEGAPETVIYDVWLDEEDLIRKMTFTLDGLEATLTAKDWGEPVDIRKPKDSELADAG